MVEKIKIRNSDFIQKTLILDGNPWRFENRPYIYPIVNSSTKRTLLKTGRQVEKSTTLSGRQLSKCCLNPNKTYLYVSPTMKQTGVYSRKKIDEAIETSPLIRKNFYPGVKGFKVEEKRLKNHTTMYFRSAFHDADSIRGITVSLETDFDEIQDMLEEVFSVVEACSLKFPNAQFGYAGTPKTLDNGIELKWQETTQCEWAVKCMGCGHWNILSIDNVILDKPGIWCTKCQHEINSLEGCWVKGNNSPEVEDFSGFCLPYIILYKKYIDWKDLFFKIRKWDTGKLMNEVFGQSYDNGAKPLTREQLIAACDSGRKMWLEIPGPFQHHQIYAGIDWGMGKTTKSTGYTVLTIGYFCQITQKFKVVFAKRFIGREAEPELMVPELQRLLILYNATVIGADWGFGFGLHDRLKNNLPRNFTYVTFRHSVIKKFLAWDEQGGTYVTNRTEVMTELFSRIKRQVMEFYNWSEFEDIGKDYLNINSEYSDTLRQLRYIHTQPDDAFHATLMMLLCWMRHTDQVPITRYDPRTDDIDVATTNMMN